MCSMFENQASALRTVQSLEENDLCPFDTRSNVSTPSAPIKCKHGHDARSFDSAEFNRTPNQLGFSGKRNGLRPTEHQCDAQISLLQIPADSKRTSLEAQSTTKETQTLQDGFSELSAEGAFTQIGLSSSEHDINSVSHVPRTSPTIKKYGTIKAKDIAFEESNSNFRKAQEQTEDLSGLRQGDAPRSHTSQLRGETFNHVNTISLSRISPLLHCTRKDFYESRPGKIGVPDLLLEKWKKSIRKDLVTDLRVILQNAPASVPVRDRCGEPDFCMAGSACRGASTVDLEPTIIIRCSNKQCAKYLKKVLKDLKYLQCIARGPIELVLNGPKLSTLNESVLDVAQNREEPETTSTNEQESPAVGEFRIYVEPQLHDNIYSGRGLHICYRNQSGILLKRRAMMGGGIQIGSRVFGLTVAHPFVDLMEQDDSTADDMDNQDSDSDSEFDWPIADVQDEHAKYSDSTSHGTDIEIGVNADDQGSSIDNQTPDFDWTRKTHNANSSLVPVKSVKLANLGGHWFCLRRPDEVDHHRLSIVPGSISSASAGATPSSRYAFLDTGASDYRESLHTVLQSSVAKQAGLRHKSLATEGSESSDFALLELEPSGNSADISQSKHSGEASARNIRICVEEELATDQRIEIDTGESVSVSGYTTGHASVFVGAGFALNTFKIRTSETLGRGTSGCWVVKRQAHEDALYGIIVAVYPDQPYALMMSAESVVASIEAYQSLYKVLSLPPESARVFRVLPKQCYQVPQARSTFHDREEEISRVIKDFSTMLPLTDISPSTRVKLFEAIREGLVSLTRRRFDNLAHIQMAGDIELRKKIDDLDSFISKRLRRTRFDLFQDLEGLVRDFQYAFMRLRLVLETERRSSRFNRLKTSFREDTVPEETNANLEERKKGLEIWPTEVERVMLKISLSSLALLSRKLEADDKKI